MILQRTSRILLPILIVAGFACHSSTAAARVRGQFSLARYDGNALPAKVGDLPTVGLDGSTSSCSILVTTGQLLLNNDGTFAISWEDHDSCDGHTLSVDRLSGQFDQHADSIGLHFVPLNPMPLYATVDAAGVTVVFPDMTLLFQL